MDAKSFSLTKQGASHEKSDKECQDYSDSVISKDLGYAIAVVCDGHGGDDYVRSHKGSTYAAYVAKLKIEEFIKTVETDEFIANEFSKNTDECIRRLEASIISDWTDRVQNDCRQHPFNDDELANVSEKARRKYEGGSIESAYGTTLIAVALTKNYWFGMRIGDGNCVAVSRESEPSYPIEWDEKCFLNVTTSLCDSDAINNFRHCCWFVKDRELPAAVFIGSDGIDDSFGSDEKLFNFYRTVLYSFGTKDFDAAKGELKDYLPNLSKTGSGDDVSLAAVMDMEAIPQLKAVTEYDIEKEKARKAEEEQKEAEQYEEERRKAAEEEQKRLEEKQREEENRRREAENMLALEKRKNKELKNQLALEKQKIKELGKQLNKEQQGKRCKDKLVKKQCPCCRFWVSDDVNFCPRCGAEIEQQSYCPWSWSDNPADIKYTEKLSARETSSTEST